MMKSMMKKRTWLSGARALRTNLLPKRVHFSSVADTVSSDDNSVGGIFQKMSWGVAPESESSAQKWLESHDRRFGQFINGKWTSLPSLVGNIDATEVDENDSESSSAVEHVYQYEESRSPALGDNGEPLAIVSQATNADVDAAVEAARNAQADWVALSPHERARHLYSLARHLQKHSRLLAVIESLDNGKPLRESRDVDVPLAIRHFYNHVGWAQNMAQESGVGGMGSYYSPVGVCGAIIPWNFPLLMLAWKVAPALAMGNTIVVKPAPWTRLSAMCFADIVAESGIPPGVINIISGDNEMASYFSTHPGVDKLAFTGSTPVGKLLRRVTAGTHKKLSLELGGKNPVVVFESADLDAVVEGVVDAIWFNQGQVCCAGSRLLVQESIQDKLIEKLKLRMQKLRIGINNSSLDKSQDMGAIVSKTQLEKITNMIEKSVEEEGITIYQTESAVELSKSKKGYFYPPTLVTGVQTTSTLVQEEIFGPVIVCQSFRTPKEAVALANNTAYGLASSVWSENIGLAVDVARKIKAGAIWINSHNMFDANACFGGFKESGIGREGGRDGLLEYVTPTWKKTLLSKSNASSNVSSAEPSENSGVNIPLPENSHLAGIPEIDRSKKMYINGKQKRPDNNHSIAAFDSNGQVIGHVGDGSRKDIRDAVEAANKAFQTSWSDGSQGHLRAQILFFLAENLSARADEFASRLQLSTGRSKESCEKEVEECISVIFKYAGYADKFGGEVKETTMNGLTVQVNEPVGVVGVVCPDEYPLLSMLSICLPALCRGNTCVVVPSSKHSIIATELYQVLDTSDFPAGVINIVTGKTSAFTGLTKDLAEHMHVNALWYFGGDALDAAEVQRLSAGNLKRTLVCDGIAREWNLDGTDRESDFEMLKASSEVKTIWIPQGM